MNGELPYRAAAKLKPVAILIQNQRGFLVKLPAMLLCLRRRLLIFLLPSCGLFLLLLPLLSLEMLLHKLIRTLSETERVVRRRRELIRFKQRVVLTVVRSDIIVELTFLRQGRGCHSCSSSSFSRLVFVLDE